MRNPTMRSLPLPLALVSGSTAMRMVLQSCSNSRRNSSGDQGCRKAARSITITSSRSAPVMRRISSRGRARTAILLPRRDGPLGVEGIEHAHRRAPAQIGQQLAQQALVLLLRELFPQLLPLRLGQVLSSRRLLQLAVAKLRRQLQPVVQVARDAQLAGENGPDLVEQLAVRRARAEGGGSGEQGDGKRSHTGMVIDGARQRAIRRSI